MKIKIKAFALTIVLILVTVLCVCSYIRSDKVIYIDKLGYKKYGVNYALVDISKYESTVLTIPDKLLGGKVTSIQVYDFTKIEELVLSDSVHSVHIGKDKLKKVHIGANLTGSADYFNSTTLEEITVSTDNPIYYSENNCVIERESNTLVLGCINSIIPDGVSIIGRGSFSLVPITEIVIPESVIKIEYGAFAHCTDLKEVYLGDHIEIINSGVFYGTPDLIINCEPNEKPTGWDPQWCNTERVLQLGCKEVNWGVKAQ